MNVCFRSCRGVTRVGGIEDRARCSHRPHLIIQPRSETGACNGEQAMKPGIHPEYRYVVFQDSSSGDKFLTRSTIETNDLITWEDGNEYPLAKVEISAFTHPFFTGQMKIVDTAGRVERFERRYGRRKKAAASETAPESDEGSSQE